MSVFEKLTRVRERILTAARRVGRDPEQIKLVAVTKNKPVEVIREALSCGITRLGENRAQELLHKAADLPPAVEWHFIGHLQTNKVRKIIDKVALIHSLDRWSLAEAISREACEANRLVRVLVQVNVAGEETKYGLSPQEVGDFISETARLQGLEVCGLMTVAPWCENPEEVRPVFRKLRKMACGLKQIQGVKLDTLSMGMTGDFEVAVEEGATILRIGTAIFGARY